MTRWLFHARGRDAGPVAARYAPASLATQGFVHCSFAPALRESIALYLEGRDVEILQIDPRLLDVPVEVAETPRGPMPHVLGAIPMRAVVACWTDAALPAALPDRIDAE